MATTIVSATQLPVFGTVMRTCDLLAWHFFRAIIYYIVVVLLIVAMSIVLYHVIGEPDFQRNPPPLDKALPFLGMTFAFVLVEIVYFVAMTRLGASNRVDESHLLGLRWWGRETCVLLRSILVSLILGVIAVPAVFVIGFVAGAAGVAAGGPLPLPFMIAMYLLLIPLLYLAGRFSLYLCSPAFGERLGLGQSWQLTRGNGWRLFLILFFLHAPFAFLIFVLDQTLPMIGTLTYSIATGVVTVLWVMVSGFGAALVYRAFVPAQAAQTPASVAH